MLEQIRIYGNALYTRIKRKKLKRKDVCLIASNCNGGCILHDMRLRFSSPFVNLWIKPSDYLKLLYALKEYMAKELEETKEEGIDYPVGLLGDIKIYFQHYASFDEAKKKWDERKVRMDLENPFVLFSDRDGCTEENLRAFERLPYENKVVFVHEKRPDLSSAVYIKGFEREPCVGACMNLMKGSVRKYYDQFDYISWFNGKKR